MRNHEPASLKTRRRPLLAALAAMLAGCGTRSGLTAAPGGLRYGVFVPGYRSDEAQRSGEAFTDLRPRGWQGPQTLLTRVDGAGAVRRALFPIQGHGVRLSVPDGLGVFASMRGERIATFDPLTLELRALLPIDNGGFVGGGHAVFLPGRGLIAASERAPPAPYQGRVEAHFGRIALRDATSLEVVERYSCHGIAPHDLALIPGTDLLAVANYGSLPGPDDAPFIVEPSITLIDLTNGRLVDKLAGPDPDLEIRHLTAAADSLFAIQVRLGDRLAAMRSLDESLRLAAEAEDRLARAGQAYLPAAMLGWDRQDGSATAIASPQPLDMRQGLSILYEPEFDEVLATFPSSHRLLVVDRAGRAVRHVIDTRRFGVDYPCGLALHPDGRHYVLTGSFETLVVMRRGAHQAAPALSLPIQLFRHSHIAVA